MYFVKKTLSHTLTPKERAKKGPVAAFVGKTFSKASSHGSKSHPNNNENEDDQVKEHSFFCSDLYSVEFVLKDMKDVASNGNISEVTFEDLIDRNNPDLLDKAKNMLVGCAVGMGKGTTLRGREIMTASVLRSSRKTSVKRGWESIVFVDCVDDAASYRQYLEKKHKFQNELSRLLAMKRMNSTLPIRFKTKLEIHSMLSLFSIIELLKEVQRDDNIMKVEFPGLNASGKEEIAKTFANSVDATAMEWSGPPQEILLQYAGENMNTSVVKQSTTMENRPTAIIHEIAKAMELVLLTCSSRRGSSGQITLSIIGESSPKFALDESTTERTADMSSADLDCTDEGERNEAEPVPHHQRRPRREDVCIKY